MSDNGEAMAGYEEARQVLAEAGWRSDMENAPRDGTHVLFIGRKGVVAQARWRGDAWVLAIQVNERDVVLEGGVAWKPLDTPDQPDPVIALCQRLLEENKVLREALRRLVADADRNQRPGGGSSVPADIRALLGEQ